MKPNVAFHAFLFIRSSNHIIFVKKQDMKPIKELFSTMPQVGTVDFISYRTAKRGEIIKVSEIEAIEGKGLAGDHYKGNSGKRQVTLIQAEHLQAVASILGKDSIDPTLTRRNIVVSGINLHALKGTHFQIGEAVLEGTGDCHPCSRMEENFGTGGYNAMRGHGGLTARIIKGGQIKLGDKVQFVTKLEAAEV